MRKQDRNRLNVNVDEIDFTIQNDRRRAVCKMSYNRYKDDKRQEGLETKMVVLSCWMNTSNGNAIKAYLIPNKRNPAHVQLLKDIKELGVLPCREGMCLTTDGKMIRYGTKPGITLPHYDAEQRSEMKYFDSKAVAIKEILEEIGKHQTIGGLNLVSLGRLPDNILIESGFERIEDLMRERNNPRGLPMWLGSPEKAVGVQHEWRDREGARKTRLQFLDLLNKILS
jgi:hypothetical protein